MRSTRPFRQESNWYRSPALTVKASLSMSFGRMVIVLATWEKIVICAQEGAKLEKRRLAKPVTGECSRVE